MKKRPYHNAGLALLALSACFYPCKPAAAQSTPAQDARSAQDRDANREELANFDRFLDINREIADQLRKDPSLVDNREFVTNHPALQTYLQDHPAVREAIRQNPDPFMRAEDRLDRRDYNRDRDANRAELANFDRFLDSHREISEQLRKDPSLVDNQEFVKNHPALQTYLQAHPGVREEIKQDPNRFMQEEARYDRPQDGVDRDRDGRRTDFNDRDVTHRHFGEFLGGHADIAARLSENPSLVKDQNFIDGHPELKQYLNSNPDVRENLMANPDEFVKASQQFSTTNGQSVKPPAAKPKPNQ
jgi:hypothetical protein